MKEFFLGLWLSISALFTGAPVEPTLGANSTISNLPTYTAPENDDYLVIVDTDTATTKKLSWANATSGIKTDFDLTYSAIAGNTSLVTVGTVTTGTWNATTLTVPYGGTSSTTLAANRLFVGNGTGNLISIAPGSSGDFLTSNGSGSAPSFQASSVNQAANYTWTGLHTFNASTSLSATTSIDASNVNSNALILNSLAYRMPTTRGASSTALTEDGNGNLVFATTTAYARGTFTTAVSATTTFTVGFLPQFIEFEYAVVTETGANSHGVMGTGFATSSSKTQTATYQCNPASVVSQLLAQATANYVIYAPGSLNPGVSSCNRRAWHGVVTDVSNTGFTLGLNLGGGTDGTIAVTWKAYR